MDKYVEDYLPYVYAKFPYVAQKDIDNIIQYGLKSFIKLALSNAWICITSGAFYITTAALSLVHTNVFKYLHYYKNVLARKIRFLSKLRNYPYDGYYYFYMSQKNYDAFVAENKAALRSYTANSSLYKKPLTFRNIKLFKYKDECWAKSYPCKYIFRYPIKDASIYENKDVILEEEFTTTKVEKVYHARKARKWNFIRYNHYDYGIKKYKMTKLDKWQKKNK